jgi:hypothetical protein
VNSCAGALILLQRYAIHQKIAQKIHPGINTATQAFPLGLKNNQMIPRMNQIIRRGIANQIQIIVIRSTNHTILKIIPIRATVFFSFVASLFVSTLFVSSMKNI